MDRRYLSRTWAMLELLWCIPSPRPYLFVSLFWLAAIFCFPLGQMQPQGRMSSAVGGDKASGLSLGVVHNKTGGMFGNNRPNRLAASASSGGSSSAGVGLGLAPHVLRAGGGGGENGSAASSEREAAPVESSGGITEPHAICEAQQH